MAITYTDLIAEVRKSIKTVSLEEIKQRLDTKQPMVLLDVREKEEFRAGYIPGAISVPRGFLEIQIEQKIPDKSAPVVAYCAGGTRSALAAKTLAELGYTHVESRQSRLCPLEGPRLSDGDAAPAHGRPAGPLLSAPAPPGGG